MSNNDEKFYKRSWEEMFDGDWPYETDDYGEHTCLFCGNNIKISVRVKTIPYNVVHPCTNAKCLGVRVMKKLHEDKQ